MKYSKKHADFLKENKIDTFLKGIPKDQQLFMVQYDSVKKFTDGEIIPILPRIEKEKFIIRNSKMNFKNWNEAFEKEQSEILLQKFNEHKKQTYGTK